MANWVRMNVYANLELGEDEIDYRKLGIKRPEEEPKLYPQWFNLDQAITIYPNIDDNTETNIEFSEGLTVTVAHKESLVIQAARRLWEDITKQ